MSGSTVTYYATVDIFDAATNSWTVTSLAGGERSQLAATSIGTKFALFAGGHSSTYSAAVDIYNSATNQWTTAQLSVARYWLAATSLGSKAIFAGGYDGSNYYATIDIFDSNTGVWSVAQLSAAHGGLAGTRIGVFVMFGGGYNGAVESAVVDVFVGCSAGGALNASGVCLPCAGGTFSTVFQTTCVACQKSTYSTLAISATSCSTCLPGALCSLRSDSDSLILQDLSVQPLASLRRFRARPAAIAIKRA